MLRIREGAVGKDYSKKLVALQASIDSLPSYAERVAKAKDSWDKKSNSADGKALFNSVRKELEALCSGVVRCCYCEDSAADEIEHVRPKNFFPSLCFVWDNYLFACGPCNGPKNDQYAAWTGRGVEYAVRKRKGPVTEPPAGPSCLIDPRSEDATQYIELDVGGVTPDGKSVSATFRFVERSGLNELDNARAEHTIKILRLNRDILTKSRKNAFGGFKARIAEYVAKKNAGADAGVLKDAINDLVSSPHLTVFFEMRRQANRLPDIEGLLIDAPELFALNLSGP